MPSAADRTAAEAFVDALPRALCEFHARCGRSSAEQVDDCIAELGPEIREDIVVAGRVCDGMVAFYVANQTALDACMSAQRDTCRTDDLSEFCPVFDDDEFDPREICSMPTGGAEPPGSAAGVMERCDADSDCPTGMRCLGRIIGKGSRYCSIPCASTADCSPLLEASYFFRLAPKFHNNRWNRDVLSMGVSCERLASEDQSAVGEPDGRSWCAVTCQENAAVTLGDDGSSLSGCACLPNFKWADEQKTACVWDPATECSIFTPCTVANTDVHECSEGDISCVVNEGLEGTCFDFVSGSIIAACVARCNWQCDNNCLRNTCGSNPSELCTRACCYSDVEGCER